MPGTRNKQASILSMGEKGNKNKVQRRDCPSVSNTEKKASVEAWRTEIISDIAREL